MTEDVMVAPPVFQHGTWQVRHNPNSVLSAA